MKRLHPGTLLAVLTLLLLCYFLPTKAEAATEGYYTYTVSNGEATITDCNTSISGAITIPSTLGSYPVISIGDSAFLHCSSLTSITIQDGVTSIGHYAFSGCSNLTSIIIPDSVTRIGQGAFSKCSGLEHMTIPFVGSEKSISGNSSRHLFGYIFGTSSYTGGMATYQHYDSSYGEYDIFYIPSSLKSVTVTGGRILHGAFHNCSGLTTITIQGGVGGIGNYAFYNCSKLSRITLSNSTAGIGDYAFHGCSSLTDITIPNRVTDIGNYAFYGCKLLENISIPDTVIRIGDSAFDQCHNLKTTTYDNAKYLGNSENPYVLLLKNTSADITSCLIHSETKIIGKKAFYKCTNLTEITIPDSVISISDAAFQGCSGLKSITIPFVGDSRKTVSDRYQYPFGYIFGTSSYTGGVATSQSYYGSGTSSTTSSTYYIPSSLKSVTVTGGEILYGAFYGCTDLTSLTISGDITGIGDYAFYNCSSLNSLAIPEQIARLGYDTFTGCGNLKTTVYDNAEYLGDGNNPYAVLLHSTSADITSCAIHDDTGVIAPNAFQNCTGLISVEIPNGVSGINDNAFAGCSNLTSITIPDSVTYIGDGVFADCGKLTEIAIPESVTYIGESAFSNCSSLTEVIIPDGITAINYRMFYECNRLVSVHIPDSVTMIDNLAFYGCSKLAGITIPKGVTRIGTHAFLSCSKLTAVTIPDSVTTIGQNAFAYCGNLTTVTLPKGLTSISQRMFYNCKKLSDIVIPENVGYIYDYAFYNCVGLTDIRIPNKVTGIGDYAFQNCTGLTSVVLGDRVSKVETYGFSGCKNLKHLIIPKTLKSIAEYAFSSTGVTQVCYQGLKAERDEIMIGSDNTCLTGAVWNYNASTTEIQIQENCVELCYICSNCKQTVQTVQKQVPTHVWKAATCSTPKSCNLCQTTEGEALGHSYIGITTVAPDCENMGVVVYTCQHDPAHTYTDRIPATGHRYSSVTINPTCTEKGCTTSTCMNCGNVITEYMDATGHSGDLWFEIITATCTEAGLRARICATCDETEIQWIKAIGHSYEIRITEPTCTEQGYTTKGCFVCGAVEITDYVPAKGHNWSAWIQITAPSCTAEGAQVHFCNCGVIENAPVQKLPHIYDNDVCTVCGDVAQYNMVLTEDTAVQRNLNQDLYVDLNGFDLSGTIITNGYKVYGMDSTTDGYRCQNIGYFTCVDENGDFIVPERIYQSGEKQYMAICTEDRYSFHRFFVGVTHMSLEPDVVGLGYKAAIFGDEMVFAQLATIKAFSFKLQLEGYNPVYRHFDSNELASGDPITLRIRNYDVENYSEHNLYAQVSLTLNDGTVVSAGEVALTFRWLTEWVNANYTDYTTEQMISIRTMLQVFDIVKKWEIPNLI